MKTSIRIAALTTLTLVGIVQAQAAVKTLAECYDLVIDHCNTTSNPQGCASSGMDECDEVFPVPLIFQPGLSLSAPQSSDPRPSGPGTLGLGKLSVR